MDIPHSVKVGALWWTIETDPDLSETSDDHFMTGITLPPKLLIKIRGPEREHHDYVRLTLFHEVLHAVNAVYCGGVNVETALEEREVEGLANGLLQVLRDNPAFTDYLLARHTGVAVDVHAGCNDPAPLPEQPG